MIMSALLRAEMTSIVFPWRYRHRLLLLLRITFTVRRKTPSHKWRSIRLFSQSRFSDLCLKTAWAGLLQCVPFARRTAFMASHRHDHRAALNDFSVSFRSSPCTSVSLNRACRLGLASKKMYRAWIVSRAFSNGSICHTILKGEVEQMCVKVDVDTVREHSSILV